MDFPSPLVRGRLIQRYKRYLADVELDDGRLVTAHVANPGAMLGLCDPGLAVWLSPAPEGTKRKLAWTLEMVEKVDIEGRLTATGVNTLHANRLAAEALREGAIPELAGYASARAEVRYGRASRVDFLLQGEGRPACWLEVKSVTLSRRPGLVEWPDCKSARAAGHLRELQAMATNGDRAAVLFVAQRSDCEALSVARDLDPAFAAELERAAAAGVEVLAYGCAVGAGGITLSRPLEWLAG